MKKLLFLFLLCFNFSILALPTGFVYLSDIDPSILQDMRYASMHNFVGKPIQGYKKPVCILTLPAAEALAKVQRELLKQNLSLKVYDCYRPKMAVDEFINWSEDSNDQKMKTEFYPRVPKEQLFQQGYIAKKSAHSSGSTVDLTIVDLSNTKQAKYRPGQKLVPCFEEKSKRFQDNSIDMGTGYDCLDPTAWISNENISKTAYQNRMLLKNLMVEAGFKPYRFEWWHFTLENQPFRRQYFNFEVE